MKNKCDRYVITAKENYGPRRELHSFDNKSQAVKQLKKILSKPKKNKYGIYPTAYRNAQSGAGINNPRIKKVRRFC